MEEPPHPGVALPAGAADAPDDLARGLDPAAQFDLVVADASWPWTERLFAPLADLGARVLLIKACDWRTALNQGRPLRDWANPHRQRGASLWEQTLILPPGWMKTYPRLGMRPIAHAIRRWRARLGGQRPLALAISYPYYLYLRDQLRPDALIYYNMDDYTLYWSARREATVRGLERRAVDEADLSIFCARVRADEFRADLPGAAGRIVHLPHGAPARAIAPEPRCRPGRPPEDLARLPRPHLGFVGSLEDRIDWRLIADVATAFPGGSVVLIGSEPEPGRGRGASWYQEYRRAVALPNVHRLGWKTQGEIARYNASFDVCLIPYRADHPFNRVCCPTKIMDYMAASRPVVSTDLPECRLYTHLFDVAATPHEFVAAIRRIVAAGSDDGRAHLRWSLARASTWERTADALLGHITTQAFCLAAG